MQTPSYQQNLFSKKETGHLRAPAPGI